MRTYQPPAEINDFTRRPQQAAAMAAAWDKEVRDYIAATKDTKDENLTISGLYFDQLADTSGVPDPTPVGVPWNAFPQLLTNWFATQPTPNQERLANEAAERAITTSTLFGYYRKDAAGRFLAIPITYRRQDEYCEWFVERVGNDIKRISFTCEPPEYWKFLAKQDITLVLELYRELLHNPSIQQSDICWPYDVYSEEYPPEPRRLLYAKGDYNPYNEWNTIKGAVHLNHWANSLSAEVRLASDASLGWPQPAGAVNPQRLICCAGFGGVNRSSDPKIGAGVYSFAAQALSVALANPIGLYMQRFQLPGLRNPDGNPIPNSLNFVRHSPDGRNILRAEVAPPPGASYSLDQCTLNGNKLLFGGQIARLITMALFAVAKKIPGATATPVGTCPVTCCPYPTNGQFFGSFPNDGKTCAERAPKQWERNLSDLLDLQGFPQPLAIHTTFRAEHVTAAPPSPVKISGRVLNYSSGK